MTTDPLVLYLVDDLDARAGADLIHERCPRAELIACEGSHDFSIDVTVAVNVDSRETWGLGTEHERATYRIVATPDASIVMQVWRRLNPCATR